MPCGEKSYATVANRPCVEVTGFSPTLYSRKQPVPDVFFERPGWNPFCPTSAADWSPRQPVIGTPFNFVEARTPYALSSEVGTILGRCNCGVFVSKAKKEINLSSYFRVWMFNHIVRLAFVGSVTKMFLSTPPL